MHARVCSLGALCIALLSPTQPTLAQRAPSAPQHYIYFGRDRARITEPAFLTNRAIAGAQLRYTWAELEPERDRYALRPIVDDIAILASHGKRLFIQIQDVSFTEMIPVPEYLRRDPVFGGGADRKLESSDEDPSRARFDGWVARRWDPEVRRRFSKLLDALGQAVDGRIEGINLAETAIGFENPQFHPPGFSYESYAIGVKEIMTAARRAFPQSKVIQYANFMPGGSGSSNNSLDFLRDVYAHAADIGVGVGGPDVRPFRMAQRANSLPLIAARPAHVIAGMAVQDGNLEDVNPSTRMRVTVAELYRYAVDPLHLDYLFWGTQEPYYSNEVLPFLRETLKGQTKLRPPAPSRRTPRAHGRP
ncbi:MAG: hypothetical protein ABMA00_12240 [Gemmatimonas sp.]